MRILKRMAHETNQVVYGMDHYINPARLFSWVSWQVPGRIHRRGIRFSGMAKRHSAEAESPDEKVSRGRVPDRLAIPTVTQGSKFVKRISEMIELASSCFTLKQEKDLKSVGRNIFLLISLTSLESTGSVLLHFAGMEKSI